MKRLINASEVSDNVSIEKLMKLRKQAHAASTALEDLLSEMRFFDDEPIVTGLPDFGEAEYNQLQDADRLLRKYTYRLNHQTGLLR